MMSTCAVHPATQMSPVSPLRPLGKGSGKRVALDRRRRRRESSSPWRRHLFAKIGGDGLLLLLCLLCAGNGGGNRLVGVGTDAFAARPTSPPSSYSHRRGMVGEKFGVVDATSNGTGERWWSPSRNAADADVAFRRRTTTIYRSHSPLFGSVPRGGGGGGSVSSSSSENDGLLMGCSGEVVGSTGRIGSLLLRLGRGYLAPVPRRGVRPGCLSPPGTPVYVAVPADEVADVIEDTVPERREDLVVLSNGLPSRWLGKWKVDNDDAAPPNVTAAVPHFGVLSVGADALTSDMSPPTAAHGRHAEALADLLASAGVNVEVVSSSQEVEAAAARKLLWSSAMWLLCHDHDLGADGGTAEPLDVIAVHETKGDELRGLVEELMPAAEALINHAGDEHGGRGSLGSVEEVLEYIESYSRSMPGAIPSKALATDEIEGRNGVLLSMREAFSQPLHEELIRRVAGEEALQRCIAGAEQEEGNNCAGKDDDSAPSAQVRGAYASPYSGLSFLFTASADLNDEGVEDADDNTPLQSARSAVVIGAGMMGSSVALQLARRGVDVTVYDRRPSISADFNDDENDDNSGEGDGSPCDPGKATTASWGWINANGKSPISYRDLNCLGMRVWARDPLLQSLPIRCGSLVRRQAKKGMHPGEMGEYVREGPLDETRIREIEPTAEFLQREDMPDGYYADDDEDEDTGEICYYPDESHVDPVRAVRTMRREAARLGTKFVGGTEIVGTVISDEGGDIVGVRHAPAAAADGERNNEEHESTTTVALADVVVVAAGIECSSPEFGGLPMQNSPGAVAVASSSPSPAAPENDERGDVLPSTPADSSTASRLGRILVDTLGQSHVLLRSDGTLVAGGGILQVGGDASVSSSAAAAAAATDYDQVVPNAADDGVGEALLSAASRLAPDALRDASLSETRRAVRPMPKDGYPAVGWVRRGLYVTATHSGVTLGPLLGELVALEVAGSRERKRAGEEEKEKEKEKEGIVEGLVAGCALRADLLEEYRPNRFDG